MVANAEQFQRVPPQSIEAEVSVLGGILLDNEALDRVIEILAAEDFYREAHRRIFRAMLELTERNEPADPLTVAEVLRAHGELEAAGGAAYLAELADRVPTAANVAQYARLVKEKAILRGLIGVASQIVSRSYESRGDVDQFLDEAEQLVFSISEQKVKPSFRRIGDIVMESIKTVERLYERKELVTGVPTGFKDIDEITAGLQPGDLIVVAGRPSMGKSALATNIAQYAAHTGVGVALFSLEMAQEQLGLRMLCSEARVDNAKVRTGFLSERDFPKLAMAAGKLAELPIYIDDTPALSVLELRAKARRLRRDSQARLGLIVVDYLQLMRGVRRVDSREQEISEISRSLKGLAKELNVPVLAVSQLNRQVEQRSDKRPVMADLRESGAIEQDADVIAFIYRDEVYNREKGELGVAEIIIAKQRNGPIGTKKLAFRREYTRFEDYTEAEEGLAEDAEEAW